MRVALRGFGERGHFLQLIDVAPMNDKVQGESDPMLFYPFEDAQLMRVGFWCRRFRLRCPRARPEN